MKKLTIGIIAIFALTLSCRKNENHQKLPTTITTTLNGIDKDLTLNMMRRFNESRFDDINPAKTNVWFDRAIIQQMYNLVKAEGGDGIRVYFISAFNTAGTQQKNSIALVSTKANGIGATAPSGIKHLDYYEHDAANSLFSASKSINGVVTYGGEDKSATLNKTCNTCIIETPSGILRTHHITRQLAERLVQSFGNHPITTISEWFDLDLFEAILKDQTSDGLRIYFATKNLDPTQPCSDAFVLIKTHPSFNDNSHVDYFGDSAINIETTDGGQDNGDQCPNNCV